MSLQFQKQKQMRVRKLLSSCDIGQYLLTLPYSALRQFEKVSSLQQVKQLYLCRKNIAQLSNIDSFPNLEILWVCSNQIKDVGQIFSLLPQIREIYLNNNQINSFKGFEVCLKLEKLNLAYNQLAYIPKQLKMPETLKSLLLTKNRICSVQSLACLNLPNLQVLYLCNNEISSARILRRLNCPNLRTLYLDNNKISDFRGYDQIMMAKNGSAMNLINLDIAQTEQQKIQAIIKVGLIRATRYRYRLADVVVR